MNCPKCKCVMRLDVWTHTWYCTCCPYFQTSIGELDD